MKYPPKKVFILENGEYLEISFEELRWRTEHDITYKNRLFLPLHGMLMEVTQEDYNEFYKADRRQRYQKEVSVNNGDISFDALPDDIFTDPTRDDGADVSSVVEKHIMSRMLNNAIATLPEEDQLLIYRHYYSGISERELAKFYGVTQQTISWRIGQIRARLKKILG